MLSDDEIQLYARIALLEAALEQIRDYDRSLSETDGEACAVLQNIAARALEDKSEAPAA